MRSLIALIVLLLPQVAHADCICLNRGAEIQEGQTSCIKTDAGNRLAVCEKNLNVTSWKFLGEECPVASKDTKAKIEAQFAALQAD